MTAQHGPPDPLELAREERSRLIKRYAKTNDLRNDALKQRDELAAALRRHCWAIIGGAPCFCKRSDLDDDGFHRSACSETREALAKLEGK